MTGASYASIDPSGGDGTLGAGKSVSTLDSVGGMCKRIKRGVGKRVVHVDLSDIRGS